MPTRRRVVDEHLRIVQPPERVDEPPVVLLAEVAAAEAVRVDARFGREHAQEELLLRHFQAEHADGLAGVDRGIERDVEHEARLPHRRPRGDDDEVGFLEARRHLVELDEAARDAGDEPALRLQLLDHLVALVDHVADADEPGPQPVLGDLEDRPLGLVEQIVGVLFGVVRAAEDFRRRLDQPAERRLLLDDLCVVLDVARSRHAVGERRDVGRAADLVELVRLDELVFDRDQIDRLAPVGERDHLLENAPVRVAEEIRRVDDFGRLIERLVVDQDRAEHALLGLQVMRQRAVHRNEQSTAAALATEARFGERPPVGRECGADGEGRRRFSAGLPRDLARPRLTLPRPRCSQSPGGEPPPAFTIRPAHSRSFTDVARRRIYTPHTGGGRLLFREVTLAALLSLDTIWFRGSARVSWHTGPVGRKYAMLTGIVSASIISFGRWLDATRRAWIGWLGGSSPAAVLRRATASSEVSATSREAERDTRGSPEENCRRP